MPLRVKAFGAALAKARLRADMSQSALGTAIGTPQSTISSWERGESRPYAETVFQLEAALKLAPGSLSQILGYMPLGEVPPCTVQSAVIADPTLDPYKGQLLLAIYETMREV